MQETRKSDIAAQYDLGNDLFMIFLDKKWQQYSCAVWQEENDSLESAQENKLRIICDLANIKPGMKVLDVGCGWGGAARYMIEKRGVSEVMGLTLSEEQKKYITSLKIPQINIELVSWQAFKSNEKFDAIISVGAFEHFAQSGKTAKEEGSVNKHLEVYQNYFKKCNSWLKDGSSMALHCITYENYPKTIEDIENVIHVSKVFFPGGRSPRVEEIFSSCRKYFDVEKMYTRRLDYKKTVLAWLERLLENEDQNIQKFGKDKFDFFKKAGFIYADLFNKRITSLAQFSMKKY